MFVYCVLCMQHKCVWFLTNCQLQHILASTEMWRLTYLSISIRWIKIRNALHQCIHTYEHWTFEYVDLIFPEGSLKQMPQSVRFYLKETDDMQCYRNKKIYIWKQVKTFIFVKKKNIWVLHKIWNHRENECCSQ